MNDPFADPTPIASDFASADSFRGRLVLIQPTRLELDVPNMQNPSQTSDRVTATVTVVDGQGPVQIFAQRVPTGKFLFFPLVNAFNANNPGESRTVADLFTELESSFFGTATELHATVDGQPVTDLNPASTPFRVCAGPADQGCGPAFALQLPADNIFGVPYGTGSPPYLSVADGWVALLHPLPPGTHTITLDIVAEFPPGTPLEVSNTTTIIVKPGR